MLTNTAFEAAFCIWYDPNEPHPGDAGRVVGHRHVTYQGTPIPRP